MQSQDTTRPRQRRPSEMVDCARCGAAFKLIASRRDAGRGRYCSPACYNAAADRRPSVTIACEVCGRTFPAKPSQRERGKKRHCGDECRIIARMGAAVPRAERFWQQVDIGADCWPWTGARMEQGYGVFHQRCDRPEGQGRNAYAHRVAWELAYGPIPDGLWVLHRCDNPPCVNPDHLFLGSAHDNKQDAVRKGRHAHGETNGESKLTAEQVIAIRQRFVPYRMGHIRLAKEYGVSRNTIVNVVQRRTWRHIP